MPKYIFDCPNCHHECTRYVPSTVERLECPVCKDSMSRRLPTIDTPTEVRELVDPYLNKRLLKDHKEALKERREKYYWEVEVPRLIEKYSLETCLENGWLKYNDKGELVINKAPSKR